MGDGFTINLGGVGVLPLSPDDPDSDFPAGFYVKPGLAFEYSGFFVNTDFRVGYNHDAGSEMGVSAFDTAAAPEFQVTTGYEGHDFRFRLGRYHYEEGPIHGMTNGYAFSTPGAYAILLVPLGWLGAEAAWDRKRESDTARRAMLSGAYMWGDNEAHFAQAQALISIALGDAQTAPVWTVAALGSARWNSNPDIVESKNTGMNHSEGISTQLETGLFTGGVTFIHNTGTFPEGGDPEASETKMATSIFAILEPGSFLLRGSVSFLNQSTTGNVALNPPTGQNETHLEITGGYKLIDSLLLSVGLRSAFQSKEDDHYLFLGFQSNWGHTFEF